ncbi:AfsA-related hotdog domain-containing protein [Roseomonas genomospecies 6]|uniref:A-factor biosynthesis hotdog domain-containing protein n=1 Tax=Roseomonas genomospecies 6 TaxID=214106 RepID=A0A9W7NJK8_9PROT|nr:AfsA-related hotdog domain-containing protein [Roseomonas genomospecies 6]KAA0680607.1 hypothetical protein DS843_12225 [Roseomonas genomospecies 6]
MTSPLDDAVLPAYRLEFPDGVDGLRAVPDPGHPFYFDHPLGHLPGLLLLDIATAAVERAAAPHGAEGLWFDRFEVTFRALAALHTPLDIRVTEEGPDGSHRCILSQRGKTCAEFAGHGTVRQPDTGGAPVAGPPFTPVPLAAVRKLRPENVFLGEPRDGEHRPLAAAGRGASALAAAHGGFYRPVYLAECFLQLCRASRREAGPKPGVIPASREVLVRLGGHLPRPVPDTAALSIAFDESDPVGFSPADPRSFRRTASILSNNDPVCHFFCDVIQL